LSRIGEYLFWLLPTVRKRKDKDKSILFGLMDTIGTVLDELKEMIMMARLRRYFLIRNDGDPYYSSELRSLDLDMHASGRGIWRLPGETDEALLARISTLPYRNRFLGTKVGMKYLIEDILGLTCEEIVEYYADDQAWIVISDMNQSAEAEVNISHVFNNNDIEDYDAYRQTRIYSHDDLSLAFHFWVHISSPQDIEIDEEVIIEAINAQKPTHTRAVVHFTKTETPVT